jgi:hypothetical protein
MIELNSKTQQDFLNREWVQRLLDAGVDMSDAKYIIAKDKLSMHDDEPDLTDYIWYKDFTAEVYDVCPTYSTAELLYKLHEWIYPTIDDKEYLGPLTFLKDAPFYTFYYKLKHETEKSIFIDENYIYAEFEYPIESLASILIQCHKKDIGIKTKDVGDISAK